MGGNRFGGPSIALWTGDRLWPLVAVLAPQELRRLARTEVGMFNNFKIVGDVAPASEAEVSDAENSLGAKFPTGYREYVTRFGQGILGGYIRIYPPTILVDGNNRLQEWRKRIEEYWFWRQGETVLPKHKALECIIVGDTLDGDELVFHPDQPNKIYVLPRHSEKIFVVRGGLESLIEWLCASGVLTDAFPQRDFEPF